jgi:hypothetical protein
VSAPVAKRAKRPLGSSCSSHARQLSPHCSSAQSSSDVSASRDTCTIRLAVPISSCIVTNRLVLI